MNRKKESGEHVNFNTLLITIALGLTGYFGNRILTTIGDTSDRSLITAVAVTNLDRRTTRIEKDYVTHGELPRRRPQGSSESTPTNTVDTLTEVEHLWGVNSHE